MKDENLVFFFSIHKNLFFFFCARIKRENIRKSRNLATILKKALNYQLNETDFVTNKVYITNAQNNPLQRNGKYNLLVLTLIAHMVYKYNTEKGVDIKPNIM